MKLSDYVIDFLQNQGVGQIFEVCGGAIIHLLDSFYDRENMKPISMHHEQAAAFAAEGYARIKNNIGVAMATSGPGATNLITGIGSCYFDSIPVIFITGQVNTYEFKGSSPVRQAGFQETDIVSIVKPIVKDAILVDDAKKIRYYLEKAVYTALSGRPGPVLLDIPMNIQRADIDPSQLESFLEIKTGQNRELKEQSISVFEKVVELVNESLRPVILVGGGCRSANAEDVLYRFVKKTGIPVVCSLMGLDAYPHDDELFSGMIGTYGNRYANFTLANADLVIVLGARLDTRQTGTKPKSFARGAHIIHVDVDPDELNNKVKAELAVQIDIKVFLNTISEYNIPDKSKNIVQWTTKIANYKSKYPSFGKSEDKINPNFFMHKLSEYMPDNTVICTDVGQNQIWAAQSLAIKKDQRFLTQGGMGAMGSSLAMAIGASFAMTGNTVVSISGDGGIQLNIQELETVSFHNLSIKIIVINNNCYGMIRQFQTQYFNAQFQSSVIGYSAPDFQNIASAYKIKSKKISNVNEIDTALEKLFKDNEPMLLEIEVSPENQALPKLSVNKPIEEQEPAIDDKEFDENMYIDKW